MEQAVQSVPRVMPRFLAALVASADDAIVGVLPEGVVASWNRGAERVFGHTAREAHGLPVGRLFSSERAEDWRAGFEAAVNGSSPPRQELAGATKDGESVWVSVTFSPILDGTGRVAGVSILARDITERHRAEVSLQQASRQWQATFDAVGAAIWLLDKKQRVLRCNQATERLLRLRPAEVLGRVCREVVHRQLGPLTHCPFQRLRASLRREYLELAVDSRWFEVLLDPILDEEGDFNGAVHILTDITARKRAEEELRRLYEQTLRDAETKSELLNEINHRVKNNLLSILGLIRTEQRFAAQSGAGPSVPEALQHLGQRVSGLIEVHQLLSETRWSPMYVAELAHRIIGAVAHTLDPHRQVTFEVSPSAVLVSPRQANSLALAFNELATNSLKHALAGRTSAKLSVRIASEPGYIHLEYRDDGPGYPPAVLERQGEGVGLALLRQLAVGAFRGSLTLRNDPGAVAVLRIKADEVNRT